MDQSECQLWSVEGHLRRDFSVVAPSTSILYNETAASLLPVLYVDHPAALSLHIDNQAVIGLLKRVRAKWKRLYST
ncbi:hypothetical protein BpHYR1_016353 [Brachionus plicatilis]|uniref:Uncharacterized protein n=1 Tax=Brachionus plicatilis TaxID=10195 RepID=A0A3M7R1J8_BRAPC|nr:hypothetical protein BpHYR1_016353 [Brachionus plicatilis]